MRIGVMGAGAVGCYYGALLAKAGHDITLIGRRAFAEQVKAHGLRFQTGTLDEVLRVDASDDPGAIRHCEIILLCVKSQDTEQAGRAMLPSVRSDAAVLSFQNGVDNAMRLQRVLGSEVVPAVLYVAAEMVGPGHVRHHGRGDLLLGASARSDALAALFTAAGAPASVSAQIYQALWGKLITNCAYNALSAVLRMPYGVLVTREGVAELMERIIVECSVVARASGVEVARDIVERVMAIAAAMPGQYSSTAQDLARGHPSEIAHLNGYVVRKGAELAVATPLNEMLTTLVRALETGHGR